MDSVGDATTNVDPSNDKPPVISPVLVWLAADPTGDKLCYQTPSWVQLWLCTHLSCGLLQLFSGARKLCLQVLYTDHLLNI